MATITVYPHLSPRVIEVDSPTTNVSVQELVNLVRAWEDKVIGMNYQHLIDAAGKENLGGGVYVGISATLQNAVIAFAMQGGVDSSGTVTTADTAGLVLTDSAGTFISDGILAGDTVLNVTDQSISSIVSVDSETQVTTFGLQSGSDNQFGLGDSYKIWNKVQCEIAGGNLVAVDELGIVMSPFLPTAQTHVMRSSSSSATLQELSAIQYSSYGGGVTIDVVNGTDSIVYPYGTKAYPCKTLTNATLIATTKGLSTLLIIGNLTIEATDDVSGYTLIGEGASSTTVTVIDNPGVEGTMGTTFKNLTLTGHCRGRFNTENVYMVTLAGLCATGKDANYKECLMKGSIQANTVADQNFNITDCWAGGGTMDFDFNGSPATFIFTDYSGVITLKNITNAACVVHIRMTAGKIVIDASCTAGNIMISGTGKLTNNSNGSTVEWTGFVTTESTRYASYNDGVTIDVINGVAGTNYPIGTGETPVNNLTNAKSIATTEGFTRLYIKGNLTIGATDVISGYTLIGEGSTFNVSKTTITLTDGCTTSDTFYEKCKIVGKQNGESIYKDCTIGELTNTHCQFTNCGMVGPVTLNADGWTQNHTTDLINCHTSFDWYILNYNASPLNQVYTNLSGKIKIINCTNALADISIRMNAGKVWIDSSCTAGTISLSGLGTLINDSNLDIDISGFTEGSMSVYNKTVFIDTVGGQAGTEYPVGTFEHPVNNLTDAMEIIASKFCNTLHIHSDLTIPTGIVLDNMVVESHNTFLHTLTLQSGCSTSNAIFKNTKITGMLQGESTFDHCFLTNMTEVEGRLSNCTLEGSITLKDGATAMAHLSACRSHTQTPADIIVGLAMVNGINTFGMFNIKGKDGTAEFNMHFGYGYVTVFNTCTVGSIYLVGNGTVTDNSNGSTVVNDMSNVARIIDETWNEATAGHVTAGTTGKALIDAGAAGNPWSTPVEGNTGAGTFGELVGRKLLTIAKFLGLK